MGPARRPLAERFWEKVVKTDTCWNWTACTGTSGYGMIQIGPSHAEGAHRIAWKLLRGEIPKELNIDHLCKNKLCVNPDHMELVTPAVNSLRGEGPAAINARKTHCIRGHALSGENLGYDPNYGKRRCRICTKIWKENHRA